MPARCWRPRRPAALLLQLLLAVALCLPGLAAASVTPGGGLSLGSVSAGAVGSTAWPVKKMRKCCGCLPIPRKTLRFQMDLLYLADP